MEIKKRLSAKLPLASRPPVGKVSSVTVRVGTDAHRSGATVSVLSRGN